ncbi:MAG: P-loop NTPase fold protein, partial [Thermomicrobiales bacterium]
MATLKEQSHRDEEDTIALPQQLRPDVALRDPKDDLLGRANFAEYLAKAILKLDAEDGFVFALNGPWGAGKTSIINFILYFLQRAQQENEQIVV